MKRKKVTPRKGAKQSRVRPFPLPPHRLPNEHDNAVVKELATAPLGSLNVDGFAHLLRGKRQSERSAATELRVALIKIYADSANFRAASKATKQQLKAAEAALASVWKGAKHLERVKPKHARGLQGAFAIPGDDPKGLDELTDFSARCWSTRLEITKIAMALHTLIRTEKAKPTGRGDRKKRLRILTEALADWWSPATGKSIAPYVQSNRRDGDRAVVHGRTGLFLNFTISMLSDLDDFKPSEVTSAVTNVHKQKLRQSAPATRVATVT